MTNPFSTWGERVRQLFPALAANAGEFGLYFNSEAAERLLCEGEYFTVYQMVKAVCEGLEAIQEAKPLRDEACLVMKDYPHEATH